MYFWGEALPKIDLENKMKYIKNVLNILKIKKWENNKKNVDNANGKMSQPHGTLVQQIKMRQRRIQ